MKAWHPDRFPGDEKSRSAAREKLKTINSAYDFLTSPSSKGHTYRPKAASQPQEPNHQKKTSAKQPPPAGVRSHASPPKGNADGQAPPPAPSAARRWGIWLGLLAGGFILVAIAAWFISQRSKQPANSAVQSTSLVQPQPEKAANLTQSSPNPGVSRGTKPAQLEEPKPSAQKPDIAEIEKRAETLDNQKRYSEARPLFDEACNAGNGEACGWLANMHYAGSGVAKDDSRAAAIYSKACDAGSPKGCTNLGTIYSEGNGGIKDQSRAAGLYSKACRADLAQACFFLGELYHLGLGVTANHAQATTLWSKACDGESADGCFFLGISYRNGDGVGKDLDKARELLKKACTMGSQEGCVELKKMQ